MQDYVKMDVTDERIYVMFNSEDDKPFAVGEKMNALFNCYLAKHAPELLEGLEPDPEAGSYMAYYVPSPENEAKAKKFVEIIASLVENEEELCRIVREEGDEIEWD